MIVVKIMGGIGNQLFQYALGRNLAIKNNTTLKLDLTTYKSNTHRNYGLNHFNIVAEEVDEEQIPPSDKILTNNILFQLYFKIKYKKLTILKEENYAFNPTVLLCRNNTYLYGYWQSAGYFKDIKELLIKELTIHAKLNSHFTEVQNQMRNCDSVAVHIRRGDYINNEYHQLLDLDYYEKGVKLITEELTNPIVFIFSDDIAWCKTHLKFNHKLYFMEKNKDWEDLQLMASCKHHIIANSSFSWWGAYLCQFPQQKVLAPKSWFLHDKFKDFDPVLPHWIKI